ncbi:hypothetical protein BC628DRAFT_1040305 [Trametes gibbosa]|nr:hypothetical protein BC628DRAFT_1040305 [Trametes gibbosa]
MHYALTTVLPCHEDGRRRTTSRPASPVSPAPESRLAAMPNVPDPRHAPGTPPPSISTLIIDLHRTRCRPMMMMMSPRAPSSRGGGGGGVSADRAVSVFPRGGRRPGFGCLSSSIHLVLIVLVILEAASTSVPGAYLHLSPLAPVEVWRYWLRGTPSARVSQRPSVPPPFITSSSPTAQQHRCRQQRQQQKHAGKRDLI